MNSFSPKSIVVGAQMLFVAFGALVLVPLLTGLDPSLALFAAGVGTLIFHAVTGGSVPIFLGSSFAFIAPIIESTKLYGLSATLGALAMSGVVYFIFSGCFKVWGWKFLKRFLPTVVTGPVIIVIGLKLAPVATQNSVSFVPGGPFDTIAFVIALISVGCAVFVVMWGKEFVRLIPILIGATVGYVVCLIIGKVNFAPVMDAAWFAIPWTEALKTGRFAIPTFELAAAIFIIPVAIAPAIEHVGDILAISSVSGKKFIEKPGLHRTFLGDGIASTLGVLMGGPPNTTYSEVTGAVALTKAFNPMYMRIAAVFAILFAFCGKLNALLSSIPLPVMGGIMMLLFGMITVVGINSMITGKVDLSQPRNMVITAIILVAGIGDLKLQFGAHFVLSGIGLAGILGILLNIILPEEKGQKA